VPRVEAGISLKRETLTSGQNPGCDSDYGFTPLEAAAEAAAIVGLDVCVLRSYCVSVTLFDDTVAGLSQCVIYSKHSLYTVMCIDR